MKRQIMKKTGIIALAAILAAGTGTSMPAHAASRKKVPATVKLKSISYKSHKVTLKWKKAKNADKYVVYYRQKGKSRWKKLAVTKKTVYVHKASKKKPLISGKKYLYAVKGYNSKGKKYSRKLSKALAVMIKKNVASTTKDKPATNPATDTKPETDVTTETRPDTNVTTERKPETKPATEAKPETDVTTEAERPTVHRHEYTWVEPVMAKKQVPKMKWESYDVCNVCGAEFLHEVIIYPDDIYYFAIGEHMSYSPDDGKECGYGYHTICPQKPTGEMMEVEYEAVPGYFQCSCGDTYQLDCGESITMNGIKHTRPHNYEYVPAVKATKEVAGETVTYTVTAGCWRCINCGDEVTETPYEHVPTWQELHPDE